MYAIDTTPTTSVPQHILRRLAPRAAKVVTRQADKHEAIALHVDSFVPLALRYITVYDATTSTGPEIDKEQTDAIGKVKELRKVGMTWSGHLVRDIPGIYVKVFSRTNIVVEDLIAGAKRVVAQIESHQKVATTPLPYADRAKAEISAAIEAVEKEWEEAQAVMAAQQEAQAEVRRLAAELQQALVSLRRTLRTVLGKSHRDYQRLRLAKSTTLDEEDAEVENGQGDPGDPIPRPGNARQPGEAEGAGDDASEGNAGAGREGPATNERPEVTR